MRPKVKVWVVFGKRTKFGDGRAQLLALIGELGSIHKAVARFGMSYRTAWGYLRELEQAAGFKLLEPGARGGRRGGTRLTKRAQRFLAQYWRFREGLDEVVARRFRIAFKRARRGISY